MHSFLFCCCRTNIASFGFVSERFDHMGIGTNEGNAVVSALLCESCVLTEETVTGMDHGDVVKLGDANDLILGKVGCYGGELAGVTDLVGFIGLSKK